LSETAYKKEFQAMKIKYSKKSLKFLAKQDNSTVARIKNAIEKLTHKPPEGDIKVMQGSDKNKMRLRVGSYRVIYWYSEEVGKIENEVIEILFIDEIGNRGDIYK
jgi:mRNA interferase RelE/StbE